EALGDRGGEIDVVADHAVLAVAVAERRRGFGHADQKAAACFDVVELVGSGTAGKQQTGDGANRASDPGGRGRCHVRLRPQFSLGRNCWVISVRMSGACGSEPISTNERASTSSAFVSNRPVGLNMPISSS